MNLYSYRNNFNLADLLVLLFFFLAPLSITFFEKQNLVILIFCSISFITLNIKSIYKIKIEKIAFIFILFYLIYISISSIGMLFNFNKLNYSYLANFSSRLFTITIGIIFLYIITYWSAKNSNKLKVIPKVSFYICFVFLLLAFYQIIAFKYHLPFFETRSFIYGSNSALNSSLGFRITSIAREPNYYSPLLFESLIIAWIVLKRKSFLIFSILTIIIMYKTYSTGVYLHAALLLAILFLTKKTSSLFKLAMTIVFLFLISIIIYVGLDSTSLEYFSDKLRNELSGDSTRSYVIITIITGFLGCHFINQLFGNGLNSLDFYNILSTNNVKNIDFSISNNLIIDFLWDGGIIGVLIFSFGLFYIGKLLFNSFRKNKYFYASFLLFSSFLITSLYRSEYASLHFFWTIANIVILYKLGKENKNEH
ncbi:O-antigen polymerase [Proteus terrae]|uniref:O-antigen polymerase n=1 Tax=Morganellaceae TaxID=1903414 RepID=UPI0034D60700